MQIIILIIASVNNKRYIQMQEIWRKYMNLHPNIKSYFIINDPKIEDDIIVNEEENTMYCKEIESYTPGITNKTIQCIDYCLQNYQLDYIYRTNLSSVLQLQNLYNFIITNNNDSMNYGGVIGNCNGISYVSGSGFLISKNACIYLVKEQHKLLDIKHEYIDDICIGFLLEPKFGIKPIDRCDINIDDRDNDAKYIISDNLFHYRCKSDLDHWYTIPIMNKLYDKLYG